MRTSQQNQAFAKYLQLFAELYKFPEERLFQAIQSSELDRQMEELSAEAGRALATEFKKEIGTYKELVQSYNDCFLGAKATFALPVESLYKKWTEDESYKIPHKNHKGYLMGDSALHIKHILEAFGLEIPKEYELMPDHLAILLELCAFLMGQGFVQEAEQLRRDHFDWLPDYHKALRGIERSGFYSYTTEKLSQALGISLSPTCKN